MILVTILTLEFGHDVEADVLSRLAVVWRRIRSWILFEILRLKFGQYFELMFGKDFEVALVKILKLEVLSGF